MPDYTVVSHDGQRPWKTKQGGSFIDHNLTVDDGQTQQRVVLTQKPETPDPQPNDVIYGHIEEQEIPKKDGGTFTKLKLKKDQRDSGSGAIRQNAGRAGMAQAPVASSERPAQNFDARSARIERQHSQEMAVRLMAAFEPVTQGRTAKAYLEVVRALTDWFVADLDNASPQKSNTHVATSPPPGEAGAVREGAAPAKPFREASAAQKRLVTNLFRQGHASDELIKRIKFAASGEKLSAEAAHDFIDTRQPHPAEGVNKLIERFGVERPSDVPYEPDGGDGETVWDWRNTDDAEVPF